LPWSLTTPLIGFLTGIMFASLSMLITSVVKNINHFNFYFTGFLSPMFFFSGVIFQLKNLPSVLRPFAECFPLTHVVRLCRAGDFAQFKLSLLLDLLFIILFTAVTGWLGVVRLKKKLIRQRRNDIRKDECPSGSSSPAKKFHYRIIISEHRPLFLGILVPWRMTTSPIVAYREPPHSIHKIPTTPVYLSASLIIWGASSPDVRKR
jgi:hypothetical protein